MNILNKERHIIASDIRPLHFVTPKKNQPGKSDICVFSCKNCPVHPTSGFSMGDGELRVLPHTRAILEKNNESATRISTGAVRTLCLFQRNNDKPVRKEKILDYGWGRGMDINNVTVTISELRRSISSPNIKIENVRGFGYQLNTKKCSVKDEN